MLEEKEDVEFEEPEASTSEEVKDEKKKHKCPECDYVARAPNRLRVHIVINHSNELRFSCSKCEKKFREYVQLRKHCQEEHPKEHICPECGFKHRVKANVDKHYKANHVNGVTCSFGCGKTVAKNMLRRHIEQCKKKNDGEVEQIGFDVWSHKSSKMLENSIKCELCGYVADESLKDETLIVEDLNMHMSRIHGIGVKCPFSCGKYLKVYELDEHLENEHDKSVDNRDELRHEDTVSSIAKDEDDDISIYSENDEDFDEIDESRQDYTNLIENKCAKCSKTFNCKRDLTRHFNRVHKGMGERNKRVVVWKYCDFEKDGVKCDKKFRCQMLLDDHMNTHKNIFPYYCQNCDEKFSARARFAVHLSKYHQTSIKSYQLLKNTLFSKK